MPTKAHDHTGQDHTGPTSGAAGWLLAVTMLGRGERARLTVERAGIGPGDHVVDVGCGPGAAVRLAAARGATVTGVDPSGPARRLGGWLTRSRRASFAEGTAEALPLADGSATVAWAISSAHHWSDPVAACAELARVLAPGGRVLIVEGETSEGAKGHAAHGFTPAHAERLAGHLRDAGFAEVDVDVAPGGHKDRIVVTATAPGAPVH